MIVCQQCQLAYACVSIGTGLEVRTQDDKAYNLYAADRLQCPGCQHVIVNVSASRPIAGHHEPSYPAMIHNYDHRGKLDRAWHTAREKERAAAAKEAAGNK